MEMKLIQVAKSIDKIKTGTVKVDIHLCIVRPKCMNVYIACCICRQVSHMLIQDCQ